jgi:hypothetical protein
MARIVGGIGASHSPTIGFAKDTGKHNDPAWKPIFDGFDAIRGWVHEKKIDVIFMIYNDHITSFFLDHYSAFVLGIDDCYVPADEGGGPREVSPAIGHLGLSHRWTTAFCRHCQCSATNAALGRARLYRCKSVCCNCPCPVPSVCGSWAGRCGVPLRAFPKT